MARELELIRRAVVEFEEAHAALLASKPESQPTTTGIGALGSQFQELLRINKELLAMVGSTSKDLKSIFELKENQESTELELLDSIGAEQGSVQSEIADQGADLANDFKTMRNFELAAGLAAAIVLFVSAVFISRRVGGMFVEISSQRLNIENANRDLNEAMMTLKSLQQEVVDKEKLSTLGRLTATVSHELRNPLSAIRNSNFVLKRGIAHLPEMAQFVDRIERNITRCDHIIADLLEYTRSRELDKHPVDLCSWLETLVHEQELPPSVSLILDLDSVPVMANLDEHRFRRVVINLVENACQAIVANRKPGTVTITCKNKKQGEGVALKVEDDGTGIPKDVMSKVFDPLFTTKSFGAGLGLSICQNLVIQHGGTIGLDSRPGEGTAFSIWLPPLENSQENAA